jgi:hypothetical protein
MAQSTRVNRALTINMAEPNTYLVVDDLWKPSDFSGFSRIRRNAAARSPQAQAC